MNLKQIFCDHIFKKINEELIDKTVSFTLQFPTKVNSYYAITKKCLKCGKETITTEKYSRNTTNEEVKFYWRI